MNPAHKTRIVTGFIIAVVLLIALFSGGWLFFLLVLAVSALAQWEFYTMLWAGKTALEYKIAAILCGAALVMGSFLYGPGNAAHLMLAGFLIIALLFLFRFGRGKETTFTDPAIALAGIVYLPFILQCALSLTPAHILPILLASVGTDTGGYYAGAKYGKRHIWPSVSPKKTWEGSLGGLVLCVVLVTIYGKAVLGGSVSGWLGMGLLLNVASQLGDFFESALKRSVGVKDSSNLLPGHGGILDRIDSILFALPTYVLFQSALVPVATNLATVVPVP